MEKSNSVSTPADPGLKLSQNVTTKQQRKKGDETNSIQRGSLHTVQAVHRRVQEVLGVQPDNPLQVLEPIIRKRLPPQDLAELLKPKYYGDIQFAPRQRGPLRNSPNNQQQEAAAEENDEEEDILQVLWDAELHNSGRITTTPEKQRQTTNKGEVHIKNKMDQKIGATNGKRVAPFNTAMYS